MKILLLIIPSMIYSMGTASNQTCPITKNASKILKDSISTFRSIFNEANKEFHFSIHSIENIPKPMYLIGEISKIHLCVCFSKVKSLDKLKDFNQQISSSDNIKTHFINVVIFLIDQIFKSIPEENIEISSEPNDMFSNLMRHLTQMNNNNNKQDKITISIKHIYGSTDIIFRCILKEEPKTIIPNFNPNEEEEEKKTLLDKKEQ